MGMKRNRRNRFFVVLLAILLAFSSIDMTAFADDIIIDESVEETDITTPEEELSQDTSNDVSDDNNEEESSFTETVFSEEENISRNIDFFTGDFDFGYRMTEEEKAGAPVFEASGEAIDYNGAEIPTSYHTNLSEVFSYYPSTRNQNPFGLCWIHTTIFLVEASLISRGVADSSVNLSEVAGAYYSYFSNVDPIGGNIGDTSSYCGSNYYKWLGNGFDIHAAYTAMTQGLGLMEEKYEPYPQSPTDEWNFTLSGKKAEEILERGVTDEHLYSDSYTYVSDFRRISLKNNPEGVKAAIMENGAVGVIFLAGEYDDEGYSDPGMYDSVDNCFRRDPEGYEASGYSTDHAVSVVGWDDSFSKEKFTHVPDKDGAWLIRNSWLLTSGEHYYSYFWMSYEEPSLADVAYVIYTEDTDAYDNLYQYDGGRHTVHYNARAYNELASVFTVSGAGKADEELLKSVSFSMNSFTGVDYRIEIYKDVIDTPSSGTLVENATTSGVTTYAGLYKVDLTNPVKLEKGTKYAVCLYTDNGSVDWEYGYKDGVLDSPINRNANASFYCYGDTWRALTAESGYNVVGNPRIKAYTSDVENELAGKYKVVFDGNGSTGGTMAPRIVGTNTAMVIGTCGYEKTGYTFDSWNTKADGTGTKYVSLVNSLPEGTILTLYAQWKPIEYKYTFNFNYSGSEDTTKTVKYDEEYTLPTPTRTGYIFNGWSLNQDGTGTLYTGTKTWIKAASITEVTLYAVWSEDRITISFDTNGGSFADENEATQSILKGSLITKPTDPTKEGFDFVGWYTSLNGGNKFDFTTTKPLEGMTLYARWEAKKYKVTFDPDGGSFEDPSQASQQVTYDEQAIKPADPTKSGYTFDKWVDSDGNEYDFSSLIKGDITLKAVWKANEYSVLFNLNGGDRSDYSDKKVTFNEAFGDLPNATRAYYNFDGWFTEAEGGTKVEATTKVTTADNISLYAHWTRKIVAVSFNVGELGTDTISQVNMYAGGDFSKVIVSGEEVDFSLPVVSNVEEGHRFKGWKDSEGNVITQESVVPDETSITLYAYYEDILCKVTFDLDGGSFKSGAGSEVEVNYGDTVGSLEAPVKVNRSFVGWVDEDGKSVDASTVIKSDICLKAVWTYKYKVEKPVFSLEDGSNIYEGDQLAITSATEGASIYYSFGTLSLFDENGALSENAILYSEPISLDVAVNKVNAVAIKNEYANSDVSSLVINVMPIEYDWGEVEEADRAIYSSPNELPKALWLAGVPDSVTYTGSAMKWDDIRVYDFNSKLENGKDYTISYKSNINPGIAYVTIKGKNDFSGEIVKEVLIEKCALTSSDITIICDSTIVYANKAGAALINPSIIRGDKTLSKNKDYTCEYYYVNETQVENSKKSLIRNANDVVDAKDIVPAGTELKLVIKGKGYYSTGDEGITRYYTVFADAKQVVNLSKVSVTIPAQEYTGSSIELTGVITTPTPGSLEILVKNGTEALVMGEHYTVSYLNNVNAGSATAIIKAIPDSGYTGTKTVKFSISKVSFAGKKEKDGSIVSKINASLELPVVEYAYGGVKVPGEVVFLSDPVRILEEGKDYKISYKNINKVGTATVTFEGIGNFTGKITKQYQITPANLVSKVIEMPSEYYGSKATDFAVLPTIKDNENILKKGTDYDVKYYSDLACTTPVKSLTEGSKYYVSIIGKNNYQYSHPYIKEVTWYSKVNLSAATIYVEPMDYVKGGVKPSGNDVRVFIGEKKLTEGKDYTLTYSNNTKVGSETSAKKPTVTVKGKGDYVGQNTAYFEIKAQDIRKVSISADSVIYSNKAGKYKATPIVTDLDGKALKAGTDYTIEGYYYVKDTITEDGKNREEGDSIVDTDILPVGTEIKIAIKGKDNYTGTLMDSSEYTYKIVAGKLTNAKVTIPVQYYQGKNEEIKPGKGQIKVEIGKTVLGANDYEIIGYANNIKKGKGSITLRGNGDYSGTKTFNFTISQKSMNYIIVFDANGGTGTMKSLLISSSKKLSYFSYKKDGYISNQSLGCWNTKPDGSGKYYTDGEIIKAIDENGKSLNGTSLTLYAQWVEIGKPSPVTYIDENNKQVVKWDPVEGASGYIVYKSDKPDGKYTKVATVKTTSVSYAKPAAGKKIYYKVAAVVTDTVSGKSTSINGPMSDYAKEKDK